MSQPAPASGHDLPADPAVRATVRADHLQSLVDAARALVDECRLELGPDGLSVCAADPAAVALVDAFLPADAFESYDADGAVVGIDLERLDDVVGMARGEQAVTLLFDAETRRLHLLVEELRYTLGLIDPEAVRSPPDIDRDAYDHSAAVAVEGREVDRFVAAASMVADHLALGVDPETPAFYVEADGDTDDVALRLPPAAVCAFEAGEAHSLFSLAYLDAMARPMPADAEVRLGLGTELPVELSFAAGAVAVTYLLSPRLVRH